MVGGGETDPQAQRSEHTKVDLPHKTENPTSQPWSQEDLSLPK